MNKLTTREVKKLKFANNTIIGIMTQILNCYANGMAKEVSTLLAEFRVCDYVQAIAQSHGVEFDSNMLLESKHSDNAYVAMGKRIQAVMQAVRANLNVSVRYDGMPLSNLTRQENFILALHHAGMSNKDKAIHMGMSIRTIEFHCSNLRKKYNGIYPNSSLTCYPEFNLKTDKKIELELREILSQITANLV